MIRMQYPLIAGNPLCDGQIHNVTPHRVSRIRDLDIYYFEYFDETKHCECTTILQKMPNGELYKVPLLDYDSLDYIISRNLLELTKEDLDTFFALYYIDPSKYIPTRQPVKDIYECMAQARAEKARKAAILYIDDNKDIYYKSKNNFFKVDGKLLSKFMQAYDIEWHTKETDRLAPQIEIDAAISRTIGYLLTKNANGDGWSLEEKYRIGNIHHYVISYQYTDYKGHTKISSSR